MHDEMEKFVLIEDFVIPEHEVPYVYKDDDVEIHSVRKIPAKRYATGIVVEVRHRGVAPKGIVGVEPGTRVAVVSFQSREATEDMIGEIDMLVVPERILGKVAP